MTTAAQMRRKGRGVGVVGEKCSGVVKTFTFELKWRKIFVQDELFVFKYNPASNKVETLCKIEYNRMCYLPFLFDIFSIKNITKTIYLLFDLINFMLVNICLL